MKLLLDTHVFLWAVSGDARLPSSVLALLSADGHQLLVSAGSLWEIVIKAGTGRQLLWSIPQEIGELENSIRSSAGKIICMSSVHEVIPWAGHVNYASSKGGVMLLMKSLAQEVAPYKIRVNSICPGAIRTPINTSAWETPDAYAALMKLVPYERIGEPEDIGNAAVFLASDMADYITGTSLYVDGGMTLYPGFATGG